MHLASALLAGLFIASCGRVCAQAWVHDAGVAPVLTYEFPALSGVAFAPLPNGQLLAYGNFTHAGGVAVPRVARLAPDGSTDATFASNLTSRDWPVVIAPLRDGRFLAVVSTTPENAIGPGPLGASGPPMFIEPPSPPLVVVNPVTGSVTGQPGATPVLPTRRASRLVRLQPDGRIDPDYLALPCDGTPHLLPLSDGRLLLWGNFQSVAGAMRNGLARLNADGTLDASFAPALATIPVIVTAAAIGPEGSVVANAWNYDADGRTRYYFARIDVDGRLDPRFAPAVPQASISRLAVQRDGAVLAGNFDLFRYSPTGALDFTYKLQIPTLRGLVHVVPLADNRLLVEAVVGGGLPAVFIIDSAGAVETDYRTLPGGRASQRLLAVFPNGQVLLLQGSVTVIATVGDAVAATDPSVASAVAAATASNATPTAVTSVVPITLTPTVNDFTFALQATAGASMTSFSASLTRRDPGSVSRLEADAAGRVLVTGRFTHIDGHRRPGLARFNADGALDLAFAPEAGGELLVVQSDGRPIVGPGLPRRLRDDGSVDPSFQFPRELYRGDRTRVHAAASDGLLLISTFEPDASRESNFKLIWLDENGQRLSTLPITFSGFSYYATFAYPAPVVTPGGTATVVVGTTANSSSVASPGAIDIATAIATATASATATSSTAVGGPVTAGTTTGPATTIGPTIGILPPIMMPAPFIYVTSNPIRAVQLLSDGRLLVTGSFPSAGGHWRSGIAWLKPDGSLDGVPAPAVSVAVGVISGATTAIARPFFPPYSLPLPDGRALVFKHTYERTGSVTRVARVRDDDTVDDSFQPPPNSLSTFTRVVGSRFLFDGGRLYTLDAIVDRNFAPALRRAGAPASAAYATLAGDSLWVGGGFDEVNGRPASGLTRFISGEVVGITAGPQSQTAVSGRTTILDVVLGTTRAATYQWTYNGVAIPRATDAQLVLIQPGATTAGLYRVTVTIDGRSFTSEPATLAISANTSRLINFSTRGNVTPATPQLAGFVCAAVAPRPLLFRAIGRGLPGLSLTPSASVGTAPGSLPVSRISFPPGILPEPVLSIYADGALVATDRGSASASTMVATARSVGAFPISTYRDAPADTLYGSALVRTLGAGAYTAVTTSGNGQSGSSLFELYDTGLTTAPPLLRNLSVLGPTGSGSGVLTVGFVIAGNGPLRFLVRGIGPTLGAFGVGGTIADPVLNVFAGDTGARVATNDNWEPTAELTAVAARLGAFPLSPGSRDAALLLTLEPGAYSVQLVGATDTTGTGMIEVYGLEPP